MSRHRVTSVLGVLFLFVSTLTLVSSGGALSAGAATSTPSCTINKSTLPIVFNVTSGSQVALSCTGLPPLHPYLLAEASLLAGIDPQAKAVLAGGVSGIASVSGLLAALDALKEINMTSLAFPISDLNGDLNYTWTVPSTSPLDPNASCPPPTEEFNSGLIGCALAMIDLTSFTPVGAGSALLQWKGETLFPAGPPTLALSTTKAAPGQTVNISDAATHSTYWWVSTLIALEGLLGGSGTPPAVTVQYGKTGKWETVTSTAAVAPATYVNGVFTPPALSGTFTVPPLTGGNTIRVTQSTTLFSFPLGSQASTPFKDKA